MRASGKGSNRKYASAAIHNINFQSLIGISRYTSHGKTDYRIKKIMNLRILPTILLLIACLTCEAQTYVYLGNSTMRSKIVCTVSKGHVYKGTSTLTSDIVLTFDGKTFHKSNSTLSSDIIATWKDGTLYNGNSTLRSAVIATWREKQMYRSTSTLRSDIMFNYRDNRVYAKQSTMAKDILLTTSGSVHPAVLYLIMVMLTEGTSD